MTAYVAGALGLGGVAVLASRRRELIARWLVWLVSAPVVGGLLALRPGGAVVLAVGLGLVTAWEYARLADLPAVDRSLLQAVSVILPVVAWQAPADLLRCLLLLPALALLPPLLAGDVIGGGRRAAGVAYGGIWLGALSGLVLLGSHALPVCVAVSVADVAAYCGGRALGGRRLSPLSPHKSVSGALVGAAAGAVVLLLAHAASPGLLVAVCIGGVAGDLLESAHKRTAGVKDAGSWLPGFGGMLDRVDSLLVALAVAVALA